MFHPDPLAEEARSVVGPELAELSPMRAAAVLGGLLTLPAFQANTFRLETLATAIAAESLGRGALGRGRLGTWLNSALASFAMIEDPPEDAFLLPVLTEQGEFRIFEGVFEKNAGAAECMLEALLDLATELPDVTSLTHEAYALLSLSEAIASRARLGRSEYGSGRASDDIVLPPSDRLSAIGRRVRFTPAELASAHVPPSLLAPYLLDVREPPSARSLLRHRPIVTDGAHFVVAAPSFLLAAWRRRVAVEAEMASWGARLAEKLLFASLRRLSESRFDDLPDRIQLDWVGPFVTTSVLRDHGPGRWVNMVIIGDGFANAGETGVDGMASGHEDLGAYVSEQMSRAEAFATSRPGFIAGAHLVVLAGWGRGLRCALPRPADGWTILHGPAEDLSTIGALGADLDDLWRIEQQKRRLDEAQIKLANLNGTLNLVEYWRSNDHQLAPNVENAAAPIRISVGTDYVLSARREAFHRLGLRSLPVWQDGICMRVRRKATSSWFGAPADQFMSMASVIHGETAGVVAVEGVAPVWVVVPKACGAPAHRVPMLDTALGWTERIVKALKVAGKAPGRVVTLTFQIPSEAEVSECETAPDAAPATVNETIIAHVNGLEATFHLSPAWFGRWRDVTNAAERALAEKILSVLASIAGQSLNTTRLASLLAAVVPDDRARFQHALAAQTYYDLVRGVDRLGYHDIPESAAALAKTGLAWDALGGDVFGRLPDDKVLPTIRASVQHLLDRIVTRAQTLDHHGLLRGILRRHEGAVLDERLWLDTAGAALALAADKAGAEQVLRERMWAGNAVRIGARLLAELIGSTPPDPAAPPRPEPSDVDVDEMLSDAVLALNMGDLHAEIENGVTPPEVVVALSGELLSDQSFSEAVVRPVGARVADRRIRHEVRRYEKRVADQEATPEVDHLFPPAFSDALAAEFGLTLDGIRTIRDELENVALDKGEAVFRMRRSDLVSHVAQSRGLAEAAVKLCVERLTMPARETWAEPPASFARTEVEPWRSGRRLAFFARPLLPLDRNPDPELLIAPGAIGLSTNWQIQRAFEGGLPEAFWSTAAMKTWTRDAAAREASDFAADVCARLKALGFEAEAEVLASKVLNMKTPDSLGDIDVFAIDRAANRVWIIEVKDLGLCRSQRETVLRLSDYAGRVKADGRPDPMLRHLRRVRYVREQTAAVAKHNRLGEAPEVRGLLVVSTPQPMIVVEPEDADARVVLFEDLKTIVQNPSALQ